MCPPPLLTDLQMMSSSTSCHFRYWRGRTLETGADNNTPTPPPNTCDGLLDRHSPAHNLSSRSSMTFLLLLSCRLIYIWVIAMLNLWTHWIKILRGLREKIWGLRHRFKQGRSSLHVVIVEVNFKKNSCRYMKKSSFLVIIVTTKLCTLRDRLSLSVRIWNTTVDHANVKISL